MKREMKPNTQVALPNKIPCVVAAEGELEFPRVKQENEMEGNRIYSGDRGVLGRNASFQQFKIGSADHDGIGNGKNYSAAAKVTEANNDGVGKGKNHSAAAKVTEGNKGPQDSGQAFDEQLEAILKTRPEWYQPNVARKDQNPEWNIMLSDFIVLGPKKLWMYRIYIENCNKGPQDSGQAFDEQLEATLKTRPEWYQPNVARKYQNPEWNIMLLDFIVLEV